MEVKIKLIRYVYHDGLWYRQYKIFREVCSEKEVTEHCQRVEKERDEEDADMEGKEE